MKLGCPLCENAFRLVSAEGWDMAKVNIVHPQHQSIPATLKIYTIYEHPKDFPDHFVLRGFTITKDKPIPDKDPLLFKTLEMARKLLEGSGKTRLARNPSDDPCIVESWL
jgi:hypothetical protein